jgi:hypothetical protein
VLFHVVQYKGVSKKVLPPPSQLKSATMGRQFLIRKWVKADYGMQAWLISAINMEKEADAQMGQRTTGPEKRKFSRPEATAQMILWQAKKRQAHALLQG